MQISGSTMLNLSLLTSDMWSVLIRIFAYNEEVRTQTRNPEKGKISIIMESIFNPSMHSNFILTDSVYPIWTLLPQVDWMYYLAFAAVAIGIIVYSWYAKLQISLFYFLFAALVFPQLWSGVVKAISFATEFIIFHKLWNYLCSRHCNKNIISHACLLIDV